jgi:fatty-acyl-CoA synthase
METPLTPMEFGRRARKLYGDREGVVDGDLRLTYEQFFARCDRWSSAPCPRSARCSCPSTTA